MFAEQEFDISQLSQLLQAKLQSLRHDNFSMPSFSQGLVSWLREIWLIASLKFKTSWLSAG